jgi:hypothetical protein
MKIKPEIDMSPKAIELRLDDVRALYRLTTSLARARIVGPLVPTKV